MSMSTETLASIRRTALVAAALASISFGADHALAQTPRAPNGPIEITVGCGAGCTPDVLMRRAAKIWNDQRLISNPIVIVNRAGGGMAPAMKHVLDRRGDENNVMALAEPVFSTPITQGTETTYDKFTPLGVFVQTQLILLTQPSHPAKNLKDMVEAARARPKAIRLAGSSAGGTDDQVMGLIEKATGVDMTFIPPAHHRRGLAANAIGQGPPPRHLQPGAPDRNRA